MLQLKSICFCFKKASDYTVLLPDVILFSLVHFILFLVVQSCQEHLIFNVFTKFLVKQEKIV